MNSIKTFIAILGLTVWSLVVVPAEASPAPASFADLAEEHAPAVVYISTTQFIEPQENGRPDAPPGFEQYFEDFLDDDDDDDDGETPRQRALSLGSGFIISADGFIVTNNHVIENADEIRVLLTNGDEYDAIVVGRDPLSDVALLKIDSDDDLPYVKFGDSDAIRVGDWVMTIGNPFGLGGTVTVGIVSARNRDIRNGNYDDFIQTDASINRGNSGGPMFNMDGEVIGVNTMIFSPTGTNIGIGFAIPASQVSTVVNQLKEYGRTRRGWIGVSIQAVTDEVAESLGLDEAFGAIISSVVDGGPSDNAGLEPGDIIIEFNGEPVSTSRDLPMIVANTTIHESVDLVILRDGEEMTVTLETGELETEGPDAQVEEPEEPDAAPSSPKELTLGMVLEPLTDEAREQYDMPDDLEGVLIKTLGANSEAAIRGIRPGDVILQANVKNVKTVRDIKEAITAARRDGRGYVLFRIYRDGNPFQIPLPIGDDE